jgi:uncharacterized membrane protein HdeD (DUF308 family)
MLISTTILAVLAIIFGVFVIAFPKLLRWAIGIYLIAFGIIQLTAQYF